ncbi:MAG: tRNA(His) guanylyltransferase Thg1 family protein, partial [Methanobacteriaceae archaeon]
SSLRVPYGSYIVIRLDGRNFSQLSRKLGLKKPFDLEFFQNLLQAACHLYKEFSPNLIYVFSDEINLLLEHIPFAGRLEKINSVFASFLSGSLTREIIKTDKFIKGLKESKPISFDSRIIPLSEEGVIQYFQERQKEAWRNCLNGYAYWTTRKDYSKREAMDLLHKKKSKKLHDILFKKGINMAHLPTWQRRGVGIYKKKVQVEGQNPLIGEKVLSDRMKIFIDWELPIFDKQFFSGQFLL